MGPISCALCLLHLEAWTMWPPFCRRHLSDTSYNHYLIQGWPSLLTLTLRWRHNDLDGVSDHQPHGCLLNRLFRRRSKKTSKLRVTGLCVGNSPHKGPVTRNMFPFDDVIMICGILFLLWWYYQFIAEPHFIQVKVKSWSWFILKVQAW